MAIGVTELLVIMVVLCFLFLPALVVALVIYGVVVANKEWEATYEGHRITLQNRFFSEKLYIDGSVVDRSGGLAFSATLRGRIERTDGSVAIVEGRVCQGRLGLTVKGHVLVDGAFVGGDEIAS